ncbi:MAG: ribonuclease PH [Rickettsiales bacterium]|nr:ribonuclease PH [Rickettsiales bacterium]
MNFPMVRSSGRKPDQLRELDIQVAINKYAEGSCMICCGDTQVICTATVDEKVPQFIRGRSEGWVTAEYSMIPRSTGTRVSRDRDKPNSRSLEIQRLIGRSLRTAVDMRKLGVRQLVVDCDVIQADGGTRCASVTGGFVAMYLALAELVRRGTLAESPITNFVAAVSCGICGGNTLLDLDYEEDSGSDADVNFVMNDRDEIVEIQGTAEKSPFPFSRLAELSGLASGAIKKLIHRQREALGLL